jgi:hypothetical protein
VRSHWRPVCRRLRSRPFTTVCAHAHSRRDVSRRIRRSVARLALLPVLTPRALLWLRASLPSLTGSGPTRPVRCHARYKGRGLPTGAREAIRRDPFSLCRAWTRGRCGRSTWRGGRLLLPPRTGAACGHPLPSVAPGAAVIAPGRRDCGPGWRWCGFGLAPTRAYEIGTPRFASPRPGVVAGAYSA